jgi:ADP-ribose diphosphatase
VTQFRITSEEVIAATGFLSTARLTVQTPTGAELMRYVVRHPGAVAAVVWDGSEIMFVRQYRSATDSWLVELPAGKLDDTDVSPIKAIEREIVEELGVTVTDVTHVAGFFTAPGFSDEYIDVFEATVDEVVGVSPDGAEEAFAEVVRMSLAAALLLVTAGEIVDAKTIIGLRTVEDRQ